MYFLTGGRGTESGLYRVSYVGPKEPKDESGPTKQELKAAAKARELRHDLEKFQGKQNPKALDFAWPHLDSPDRPDKTMAEAERWAAGIKGPAYAIDDQTAIKVTGGSVEVISEGHWKLFNPAG